MLAVTSIAMRGPRPLEGADTKRLYSAGCAYVNMQKQGWFPNGRRLTLRMRKRADEVQGTTEEDHK